MAVKVLRKRGTRYDLSGLSSDSKPTTIAGAAIGYGSTFYQENSDPPVSYVYVGSSWVVDNRRGSGGSSDPASAIHAADAKATPADADEWGYLNSVDGAWTLVKATWAQIKATLKTYFDGLYRPIPVVTTIASSATPTPAAGTAGADILLVITALTAAAQLQAPSGTPVQGQNFVIRIKDDGTGRALTYVAAYRAIGVTLPTTTSAGKTLYIGGKYNTTDNKLDVLAVSEEA